jgi:hypothetical protein
MFVIVFICTFPFIFPLGISRGSFSKVSRTGTAPSNLINWLMCERALGHGLPRGKRGQVELWAQTPNELSASPSLPAAEMQCQYWLLQI